MKAFWPHGTSFGAAIGANALIDRYRFAGGETRGLHETRIRRLAVAADALPEMRQQAASNGWRQGRLAAHDLLQLFDQDLEAVLLEQIAAGAALQGREEVLVVRMQRGGDLDGGVAAQLRQQRTTKLSSTSILSSP